MANITPDTSTDQPQKASGWLVQVFRSRGLQVAHDHNFAQLVPRNKAGALARVRVDARQGALVVVKLKLRITLLDNTGRCIYQVMRRGNRAVHLIRCQSLEQGLLFVFRDAPDCLAFCDRFIELNPRNAAAMDSYATNDVSTNRSANGEAQPARQCSIQHQTEAQRNQQANDVYSYMVRLLLSDDFRHYVDSLQELLQASPEGRLLLESLVVGATTTVTAEAPTPPQAATTSQNKLT